MPFYCVDKETLFRHVYFSICHISLINVELLIIPQKEKLRICCMIKFSMIFPGSSAYFGMIISCAMKVCISANTQLVAPYGYRFSLKFALNSSSNILL